jgi:hypothetical protein
MNGAPRARHGAFLALTAALLVGCTPLHVLDVHTTSAPGPRSLDLAALAPESVVTLGVLTPAGLQGFSAALSLALTAAVAEASPLLPRVSSLEAVNAINAHGLAGDYGELIAGFARTGILDRARLHGIGSALRCRYFLLPGLTEFREILLDKFEISGLKIVQNRITTLRLWLQLWDTQTGRLLWEATGEASVASELIRPGRTVPFDEVAQKLWLRMIREGSVERRGS